MFPNLRLMLSASLATVVLVAIVGSSLVLFRPAPARMAEVPEIVRPIVSIVEDNRPLQLFDTGARRSEELQRLLALPPSPVRAYAPEPPATFPYEVTAAPTGEAGDAATTTIAIADPSPPAAATPTTEPPAAVQPVTATAPAMPEADDTAVAEVIAAAPEPAGAIEPAPVVTAEPPAAVTAMAEPSAPVTAANEADALSTPSISPSADGAAGGAASATAPAADAETFPVSSIPAIEDAPIPRRKPQFALADPQTAIDKTAPPAKASTERPPRVKAKPRVRRNSILSGRIKQPLPPPTAFEAQQGQFQFFDNRPGSSDGGTGGQQNNWGGRNDPATTPTTDSQQRRAYGIRPPTAAAR